MKPARLAPFVLALASALAGGCHAKKRLTQWDCQGYVVYAYEQQKRVRDAYPAGTDLDDDAIARILAVVRAESEDARTEWRAEREGLPLDCFIGAIDQYWLRLDALEGALGAAGPGSSDRAYGRIAVAREMERFERETLQPFAACQNLLSARCAAR
jgi:hypothetical protein